MGFHSDGLFFCIVLLVLGKVFRRCVLLIIWIDVDGFCDGL